MAIFFALLAFLGWGSGDIFGGIVARKIGGYSSAFWSYVISLILTSAYIPFAIGQLHNLTLSTVLVLLALMPIGFIPLMTLYEGIRVGSAPLVGTIAAAFGAVVAILSIVFLGDKVSVPQIGVIAIIIVGIFLSSLDFHNIKIKQLVSDKGIPYALVSMILWGIYFTFVRIPARQIGWFWPAYFSWLAFLPLVLIFMAVKKVKLEVPKPGKITLFAFMNSLLLSVGSFAYNFATASGQTSIVGPVASSYPILFATLAYFVFKDRLTKQQVVGILITLFGIIALAMLS